MTELRLLRTKEMPEALRLWVQVFEVEAKFFKSLLAGGDPDDFSVGAFESDRLVSSVHVFMRGFRDGEGRPTKVGGIGSVSTLPEARKRGLSGQLLELATAEMDARGCEWSHLVTGVNDHYARYGWRSFSTPTLQGTLKMDLVPIGCTLNRVTIDDVARMQAIHAIHSKYRPMANVRSDQHWRKAVRYRITRRADEVFLRDEAYLVCRREGGGVLSVVEAEGSDEGVARLIRARFAVAVGMGQDRVASALPPGSHGSGVVASCCTKVWPTEDLAWMAKPIGNRLSWTTLAAILMDPAGRRSDLDGF